MQFLLSGDNDQRIFYRPQGSCGKVIFSQASVILYMGGGCIRACTGADTPLGRHPYPWADTPTPWATPPGRHPLGRHPVSNVCWDTHTPAHGMLGYMPPPPRRPLLRTVRILLEYILVAFAFAFAQYKFVNRMPLLRFGRSYGTKLIIKRHY